MADPLTYRPLPGSIPTDPGVYTFRDPDGRVIYVGKAKNLRQRLNSYFGDITALHPRTATMVTTADSVQWTVVVNEIEALQLEFTWIKQYSPRFNVQYRDDKSYPELAITMSEEIPRLQITRGKHKPGVRYFGPYSHAWAIREVLDLMLPIFPARTCSTGVLKRAQRSGRPCLLGYIGRCAAPCVGWVSLEQHREIVEDFSDFMSGKAAPILQKLEGEMLAASDELDFEKAARLRDQLTAVRKVMEKQTVVLPDGTSADVIGLAGNDLQAAVQIFHIRDGRIRGQRGWIAEVPMGPNESRSDRVATEETAGDRDEQVTQQMAHSMIVENLLLRFYGQETSENSAIIPREIIVPILPPDPREMAAWLSGLRGSRVSLRVAQRGAKKTLAETVHRNAQEALAQHRLRRAADLTARSAALSELAEGLGMDNAPLRIECIDISHTQGTNVVASLVVFEDGLAKKSDYRRFNINDNPGDDPASIAEVVRRRFAKIVETPHHPSPAIDPDTGRPRRFAYPPQLLVVDGGQAQVNAAAAVLGEYGLHDITVCGLAKRLEEVWLPGEDDPVIFARSSEALYLLQRLRDEAHRFAIAFHRSKRSRQMTASLLDDVPGLGPTRKAALLAKFPSLMEIRAATKEQLMTVEGIGGATAEAIMTTLQQDSLGRR